MSVCSFLIIFMKPVPFLKQKISEGSNIFFIINYNLKKILGKYFIFIYNTI